MNDPTAVEDRDGDATIEERAAEGEAAEPQEEPVRGDAQLSLNLGGVAGRNKRVEEATVALSAQEVAIDGLLKPDVEYLFLVRGRVQHYVSVPVRDKVGNTSAWKQRQPVRTLSVRRADDAEAIRELFADLLGRDGQGAAALLDELREFVTTELKAAA